MSWDVKFLRLGFDRRDQKRGHQHYRRDNVVPPRTIQHRFLPASFHRTVDRGLQGIEISDAAISARDRSLLPMAHTISDFLTEMTAIIPA